MSEIPCPLWHAALRFPQEIALDDGTLRIDYAEYNARVSAVAAGLRGRGIKTGDRVGLIGPNSIEQIIAMMAVIRIGAIACPISYRFPRESVDDLVDRLLLKLVLTEKQPGYSGGSLDDYACPIRDLAAIEGPVAADPQEYRVSLSRYSYATIVQTSGSSGDPGAALHCYANHYYSALGSNENIRLAPGDRWLLALPLFHVGGIAILFRCILAGATVVVEPKVSGLTRVEPGHFTHCSLVPTQLRRLLGDPASTRALAQTKAILVGGAAVGQKLLEAAYDARWPIHTTYGMTETSSQLTTTEPGAPLAHLYSSGRLLPHRRLKISPEREILVAGETLFVGYVENERIDRATDDDGWFHTGDIGELDRHGCLTVHGRYDNMFISGGENVHPEAIERALRRLDDVEDALVVPVIDAEFGERPFAFLKMVSFQQFPWSLPEKKLSSEREAIVNRVCRSGEFRRALETELPRYMIPAMCAPWPLELSRDRLKPDRSRFEELAEQLYRGRD